MRRLITYLNKFWQIQWSNKKYSVKCLASCLITSNYYKPLLLITTKDIFSEFFPSSNYLISHTKWIILTFSSKEKAFKNICQGYFPSKLLLSLLNPSPFSSQQFSFKHLCNPPHCSFHIVSVSANPD